MTKLVMTPKNHLTSPYVVLKKSLIEHVVFAREIEHDMQYTIKKMFSCGRLGRA